MNTALLRPEVQEYLAKHRDTSLDKFIFKGSPFPDIRIQELAQQLDGKRRAKIKLPIWYSTAGILFPPKLNLEQTSSAFTAMYKAALVSGDTLIDMTGGFGVDSYYFSKHAKQVHHIEMNEEVSAFAKANFKTLNATNIDTHVGDSIAYLREYQGSFDTIYLDPARRDEIKRKVFKLSDCVPDVSVHIDLLLEKGNQILLKTSPLLDISAGIRALKKVKSIHIIAIQNEVTEILWCLVNDERDGIEIITVNKKKEHIEKTMASLETLQNAVASYALPQKYLYEPNAAIMKAGAFNWISEQYGLSKLHSHSHLYTNEVLKKFPGRRFQIIEVLPFDKQLKKRLNIKKANITIRNFKLSVNALREKLKIGNGGDTYLFFTTDCNDKQIVIKCIKAKDEVK